LTRVGEKGRKKKIERLKYRLGWGFLGRKRKVRDTLNSLEGRKGGGQFPPNSSRIAHSRKISTHSKGGKARGAGGEGALISREKGETLSNRQKWEKKRAGGEKRKTSISRKKKERKLISSLNKGGGGKETDTQSWRKSGRERRGGGKTLTRC